MYFANPYPPGNQLHRILEVLKDLQWHCSKCELPGSQPAKPLQVLRQHGWQFEKTGSNWEKRLYCNTCAVKTSHRKLASLEKADATTARSSMPPAVRERVVAHYGGVDELLGYRPTGRAIEVDHRVPQVRWTEDEAQIDPNISKEEIQHRFMLLVREHNLLKSRNCEACAETGLRQPLFGIEFYFLGTKDYSEAIGCEGCGWHNPRKWKEELNQRLMRRADQIVP